MGTQQNVASVAFNCALVLKGLKRRVVDRFGADISLRDEVASNRV